PPRSIGNTRSGPPGSRPFQTCPTESFHPGLWFLEWSAHRHQSFPTSLLPDQLGRAVNSHSKSQISYVPAYPAALGRPGRCGELTTALAGLQAVALSVQQARACLVRWSLKSCRSMTSASNCDCSGVTCCSAATN